MPSFGSRSWDFAVLLAPTIRVHLFFKFGTIYAKQIGKGFLERLRRERLAIAKLPDVLRTPFDFVRDISEAQFLGLHLASHCF